MDKNNFKQRFGAYGEKSAAEFLIKKGFSIIERNYRFGKFGEIDIIAAKEDLLIFVEVKSRNNDKYGGALYSINKKKIKKIYYIAKNYIDFKLQFSHNLTFRIDLIAIENGEIEWIEDIYR